MEKYIVVRQFKDKKDNKYFYDAGDVYPREGMETTEERIKELSTKKNKNKKVYIKKIKIENNDTQEKAKEDDKTQEEKQDTKVEENKEKQDTKVEE